jgi:predicted aldo/keto reductase-like oxidoreductase
VDRYTYGFEEKVWPPAAKKDIGLVAMKVFGGMQGEDPASGRRMMPAEHLESALRYALSLPHTSLAVVGMATREELHQNLAWAKKFQPLTAEEGKTLESVGRQLAEQWGAHLGPVK